MGIESVTSVSKANRMRGTDSNIHDVKGMGRGRTPCCDRDHVNRGPWSPAEDLRLISFIQKYGHDNWRALPKQAGLLRCGKSCRLRWVNYLRPDLKRGNFTKEEEKTIFRLHQSFGNKWSKIAAHLPGRTDNEIKNVWNTHLKKKLAQTGSVEGTNRESSVITPSSSPSSTIESNLNYQKLEIDSQMNMLPHFSAMKTGQLEFPKINYAPMVNEMAKLQDSVPFNDLGSMNLHPEQFVDSNGLNQLEDFTIWQDPNLLDLLLGEDPDPNWGLPTPDIQHGPTYNKPAVELETEPDFDLCGMLNHDVVSAHANPNDKEEKRLPMVETPMIRKNMETAIECITERDIDSLLESFENVPELPQISPGMFENSMQYLWDVPKCSSAARANANETKEMTDLDFFPMWPS